MNLNPLPQRQVYNNYSQMNNYNQSIQNQPNLNLNTNQMNYRQPTVFHNS